jgi:hypothetical protein
MSECTKISLIVWIYKHFRLAILCRVLKYILELSEDIMVFLSPAGQMLE